MLKLARRTLNLISLSVAGSILAFFVSGFFLENPQLLDPTRSMGGGVSNGYSLYAGSTPAPQGDAEQEAFISERALEISYDSQTPAYQATWDTVADTLYRKIGAYDLRFELTDDPQKNCGSATYQTPGGCYHSGGVYDRMIFISPDGIGEDALDFITFHEYSHHLQHSEGGTRFSPDTECDADLRALDLRGSWAPGFEHQCLALGMDRSELTFENLPNLESQLAQSR